MSTIISKVIAWALGNKWGLVAAGLLILVVLGVGKYLVGQNDKLTAQNQTLALEYGKLIAAAEGQDAVIKAQLTEIAIRDAAILQRDEANHEITRNEVAERAILAKAGPEYNTWGVVPVPDAVSRVLAGSATGGSAD